MLSILRPLPSAEATSVSDNNEQAILDRISESRRSVLKKGAFASGALALGGMGTATGQETPEDDDGLLDDDLGGEALINTGNFYPNAHFTFESGVINWVPNVPDVRDSVWADFNTYQIRWLNTNNINPLWVAHDANVGEYDEDLGFVPDADDDADRPQVWEMEQDFAPFGDNEYLMEVEFSPVDEDEADAILDNDDWWQDVTDEDDQETETPT